MEKCGLRFFDNARNLALSENDNVVRDQSVNTQSGEDAAEVAGTPMISASMVKSPAPHARYRVVS